MSEVIIKKEPKKSDDESRSKRRWMYVIILSIFLVLVVVGAIFIPGIIKNSQGQNTYISNYTVDLITDSTSLASDKSLTLSLHNETLNKDESLRFSSSDPSVGVGPYLTKPYIFEDRGGTNSNVTLKFSINEVTIKTISYEIYVSDIDGHNITKLVNSDIIMNIDKSVTYLSNSDIFINRVVINYTVL